MKICIVGGSGYIGGWLIDHFLNKSIDVVSVLRNIPSGYEKFSPQVFKTIVGNISDPEIVEEIISEAPDFLIYTISLNHFDCEIDIANTLNVNVSPLIYLGKKLSLVENFRKLIYFSTMQVLGKVTNGETYNEQSVVAPLNLYGLTHLYCEQALEMLSNTLGLSSISLRLANSYGAPKYPSCNVFWLVINDFCKSGLENGVIQLKSDGSPQRDFIYLKDVVRAVEFLLTSDGPNQNVINISSGDTYTMLELALLVKKVFKEKFNKNVRVLLPDGYEVQTISNKEVSKLMFSSSIFDKGFNLEFDLIKGIHQTLTDLIDLS